jgi:NAD(P)-dependent dehydrogenase (short-subunit alcohol dehydrogenase family)
LWHRQLAVTRAVATKDEIALVAGSVRRIRFATSRALAGAGATVVIVAHGTIRSVMGILGDWNHRW